MYFTATRFRIAGLSLATIAMLLTIVACGGGGGSSGATVTPQSYYGPGSKWDVDLAANGDFTITRRPDVSSAIDLTVNGNYERLPSGFLKLTVASATGIDAPTPGSEAWGLEIAGYALLLKPVNPGSDQVIPMVTSGTCAAADFDANWVLVKKANDSTADDPTKEFFGTFSFSAATTSATLPHKFALANNFQDQGSDSLSSGSCVNGIMTVEDAEMYLTDNGGAIVHTNISTPDDASFIFALAQKPITNVSSMDGVYAGMLFDGSSSGDKVQPVSMSCSSGLCTGNIVTDITTGAMSSESVTVNLSGTVDGLSSGIITGTIAGMSGSGNLACMADVDALNSGTRIVSCVGQSPGDTTNMFNIILVSRPTTTVSSYIVSSAYQLIDGTDVLGLDGTTFDYQVTPDPTIVNLFTFTSGSEETTYELGNRTLSLSGTLSDGAYAMDLPRQNTTFLDAATVDRFSPGGSTFNVGIYRIEVPSIRISLDGSFETDPGADPLPSFHSNDVTSITLGSFGGVYGIQVWDSTSRIARYDLGTRFVQSY